MLGLVNAASFVSDHLGRFNNSKNGSAAENKFINNVVKGNTLAAELMSLIGSK